MVIYALSNSGRDLPDDCKNECMGIGDETEFAVTAGRDYIVYAITVFLGYPWYYVCTDDGVPYPKWTPAPLFEVVEGSISKYWEYGYLRNEQNKLAYPIFAFKEWARDLFFYDRLTDGDPLATEVFERYKALIDQEADVHKGKG